MIAAKSHVYERIYVGMNVDGSKKYQFNRVVGWSKDGVPVVDETGRVDHGWSDATVIPSQPGWFIVTYHAAEGDAPEAVFKEPVIAWRITTETSFEYQRPNISTGIEPITVDEHCESSTILAPDGTVRLPWCQSWDTLTAWQNDQREEAKK